MSGYKVKHDMEVLQAFYSTNLEYLIDSTKHVLILYLIGHNSTNPPTTPVHHVSIDKDLCPCGKKVVVNNCLFLVL